MKVIWKRELQGYFYTPVGWVFVLVFLLLSGVMFSLQILGQRSGDLPTFIGQMSYLWMILCPILTMRLMAEEKQRGTDQLLLSSPVSQTGIVAGKYLSALTVMGITMLLSLVYPMIIAIWGTLYAGEMMVGYLGLFLEGCAFLAVDLFVSGFAGGQVTAVLLALMANFLLWMLDMIASVVPGWIGRMLDFISLYTRTEPFLMGQLSFSSVIFEVSVIVLGLAFTVASMEWRRQRGRQG
ncbi:MAG: ABC transporter permease subunit [Clostridia bacterium]|nr:ABC transporter permease subunit [Clostridia bacterium]